MGIYDREYYQGDDAPQGFNLGGRQRMMVTNIVLVTVAIFIIDTLASGNLTNLFALDLDLFRHPWKIYQLLTYGFVHAGPWHVGLNMFMLWMFGRVIEERLGRREFLLFYLAAIIFSGPGLGNCQKWHPLEQRAISGSTPPSRRCVWWRGGGVHHVRTLLPQADGLSMGLDRHAGLGHWSTCDRPGRTPRFFRGENVTAWEAHLGGAAFAFLYLKLGLNLTRYLPGSGSFSLKLPRRGPKLRIHNPEDDANLAAEADRILAKVHQQGEQSLTSRERRILEKYSRRVRDRRN